MNIKRIRRTSSRILAGMLFMASVARADPPSSVLQAVSIETASGTVSGFTAWSNDKLYELNVRKTKERNSKTFIEEKPTENEIHSFLLGTYALPFFTDIYKVANPKEMLVTTKPIRTYKQGEFKSIQLGSHPLNGFTWYGEVNTVKRADVEILNTKPTYTCGEQRDGCCTHYFWLSYDQKLGEKELAPFCAGPFMEDFEQRAAEMQKTKGVYRLGESTD